VLGVFPDTSIIDEELKEIDGILNAINNELNNINSQSLSNIQSQLQAINSELNTINSAINNTNSELNTINSQSLSNIQSQLTSIQNEINSLTNNQITDIDNKINSINNTLSSLQSEYSSRHGFVIFTSSQNWTVPSGVYRIKALVIGGGGGGGGGSSAYVGGGGGTGGVLFVDMLVTPGLDLKIVVGAGGSPGAGGSSPTSGGTGGESYIGYVNSPPEVTSGPPAGVLGGGGGGAASSSANGSAGSGYGYEYTELGEQGADLLMVLAAYFSAGVSASGQTPGLNNILNETYTGTSNADYGFPNGQVNLGWGAGGYGGDVNANGNPGVQGVVVIWWGD